MDRYERIVSNVSASGMTSEEFWDFFRQYAEREANNICSARFRRNNKILSVMNKVAPVAGCLVAVVAVIVPFI